MKASTHTLKDISLEQNGVKSSCGQFLQIIKKENILLLKQITFYKYLTLPISVLYEIPSPQSSTQYFVEIDLKLVIGKMQMPKFNSFT